MDELFEGRCTRVFIQLRDYSMTKEGEGECESEVVASAPGAGISEAEKT